MDCVLIPPNVPLQLVAPLHVHQMDPRRSKNLHQDIQWCSRRNNLEGSQVKHMVRKHKPEKSITDADGLSLTPCWNIRQNWFGRSFGKG